MHVMGNHSRRKFLSEALTVAVGVSIFGMAAAIAQGQDYRKWMCVVCGFIYDEANGLPDEGIAAGTRWEDVPDTWACPECGVTKSDFEMTLV